MQTPQELELLHQIEELQAELASARAAAQNAAVAKARFLANMSHELRTPLNAVLGFAEVLAAPNAGAPASAQYRDYVAAIHDGGQRLSTMLDNLLEMARLEAGKMELIAREIAISAVVASAVQLVRPEAEKAQRRVDVEIADDCVLLVDERALRQVLLNILRNAIKFSKTGGHVNLSVKKDRGSGLVIRITDTGIGMNEADIPKVLEPFTQVSDDLARSYEGAGLGLPVAKGLVELHDGRLEIDSEVDVGTTVRIILPAYRVKGHEPMEDSTLLEIGGGDTRGFEEHMVVEFEGNSVAVFAGSGNCVLGRNREKPNEVRCDIVVNDQRVSRPHACIRCESDGFWLFDQSRRGTHVVHDDGSLSFSRQDQPVLLKGAGKIYLGVEPHEVGAQAIQYRLAGGQD
jgi:nitrogen-specific signal transduction histidine kinase